MTDTTVARPVAAAHTALVTLVVLSPVGLLVTYAVPSLGPAAVGVALTIAVAHGLSRPDWFWGVGSVRTARS